MHTYTSQGHYAFPACHKKVSHSTLCCQCSALRVTMESNFSNSSSDDIKCTPNDILYYFCVSNAIIGSIGVALCIVALIIAIVSRFFKDTVQRLILYKLITVLLYYLGLIIIISVAAKNSNLHKIQIFLAADIGSIIYCANSVLTFWLTLILYLCIVHLKELKNFKKLEPVTVVTSCIPFLSVIFLPFASYNDCEQKPKGNILGEEKLEYIYITGYCIAGLLHLISSILLAIIFHEVRKRSRLFQGQDDNQTESPLLTSNKLKTLSKQLLPLVVYPIVNTVVAMIVFPLAIVDYKKDDTPLSVSVDILQASLGMITSIVVILHLVIVKCTKRGRRKRRRRKEWEESQEALCIVTSNHNDVFTNETIASTDASTSYLVPRTTSLTLSQLVVN